MKIIFIVSILIFIISLIFCLFNINLNIKLNKHKNKISKTSKKIIEYLNNNGDKYYIVYINDKSTDIKWLKYSDAEFFYNHYVKFPISRYRYEYTENNPYWTLYLDNDIKLFLLDKAECDNKYHYNEILKNPKEMDKYFLYNDGSPYHKTLEQLYNNILNEEFYLSKVVLSNEEEAKIDNKIDNAIVSNDIKELRKIIDEYKDTVNLSMKIAEKLCK